MKIKHNNQNPKWNKICCFETIPFETKMKFFLPIKLIKGGCVQIPNRKYYLVEIIKILVMNVRGVATYQLSYEVNNHSDMDI